MMTIKSQFTDEEVWTKALKFMLTNLKFLIAWVSKNYEKQIDMDEIENESKSDFEVSESEDNFETEKDN